MRKVTPETHPQSIHFQRIKDQGSLQPKGFPPLPEGWVSDSATFKSSDGALNLYSVFHHRDFDRPQTEKSNSQKTVRQILVILHGLGEHGGRYLHAPFYLQDQLDGVFCLDHRGHGRSEGLRGHIDRFDLLCEDAAQAILRFEGFLKSEGQPFQLHLLGHSLGGLIALRTLILFSNLPFKSVTLSAPLLGIRAKVPRLKKAAAGILTWLWGTLQLDSELDTTQLSHDPEVGATYRADRLVHSKVTPLLFREMQWAMAETLKFESGLNYYTQFLIPMKDPLVDSDLGVRFVERLQSSDKGLEIALKTYPEFFHESFNEIGKEHPFEDLKQWIKVHSKT